MMMEKYWNTRVRNLSPYIPGEQPRYKKFIKLNTNENPYPPPPAVLDAMKAAVNDNLRLYPDPLCTELREALAEAYSVGPEQIFVGNGSDEVLAFCFGAFFESDEAERGVGGGGAHAGVPSVIFPEISYSFYPVFAKLWKTPYTTISLQADWTIKADDYLIQCGGVVLANPNAPTGIAMKAEEILTIADFQAMHNRIVIIDEAYSDFGDSTIVPYINSAVENHDNMIIVKTLSKSFSLAGLRVGFAIGEAGLINALERMRDSFNSYTLDAIAQAGAAAAIRGKHYFEHINKKIRITRDRVSAELIKKNYTVLPSSANFIFIKHPSLSGADFAARLRRNNILVRHFTNNKTAAFIRVTIGSDTDMDKFLASCP
jgi:histidinol-phosphate aminotransferase